MNVGEVRNFTEEPFLEAAEALLAADEFERALLVLDNLPAYYRDHVPYRVKRLKALAYEQWMNLKDYSVNPKDMMFDPERAKRSLASSLRGVIMLDQISALNKDGEVPHIVDMGPGDFWLAQALKAYECKFTYYGYCIQEEMEAKVRGLLGPQWLDETPKDVHVIFNASEIIEHLPNPSFDIPQLFHTKAPNAKTVYVTTPQYTYGGGNQRWKEGRAGLTWTGHLRAYTPNEFIIAVSTMFTPFGFTFEFIPNEIMMMKGTKT